MSYRVPRGRGVILVGFLRGRGSPRMGRSPAYMLDWLQRRRVTQASRGGQPPGTTTLAHRAMTPAYGTDPGASIAAPLITQEIPRPPNLRHRRAAGIAVKDFC
jgi:hypothetical protein